MTDELSEDFRQEVERYQILSFSDTKGMKLPTKIFAWKDIGLMSSQYLLVKKLSPHTIENRSSKRDPLSWADQ